MPTRRKVPIKKTTSAFKRRIEEIDRRSVKIVCFSTLESIEKVWAPVIRSKLPALVVADNRVGWKEKKERKKSGKKKGWGWWGLLPGSFEG